MEFVPVVARMIIGAVLLWAGISKLRSKRWPILALEMGTPRFVIIALPAFEAVLGLALILQVATAITPWVALSLLVAFTVVVVVQYLSGSERPCNCFGGKGEEAVGRITIARNVVLVLIALLATF